MILIGRLTIYTIVPVIVTNPSDNGRTSIVGLLGGSFGTIYQLLVLNVLYRSIIKMTYNNFARGCKCAL